MSIQIAIGIASVCIIIILAYMIWKYCLRHRFRNQDNLENADGLPPKPKHSTQPAKPEKSRNKSPEQRSRERRSSHRSNRSSVLQPPLEMIEEESFHRSNEESGNNPIEGQLNLQN